MQHFAARQRGADREPRAAALFGIDVVLGDGDQFFVRKTGFADEQPRHELGERCDRQHGVVVLAEQHLVRILVDHQRDARFQVERVIGSMQAGQLAEGLAGRRLDAHDRAALNGHHGLAVPLVDGGHHVAATANDLLCLFGSLRPAAAPGDNGGARRLGRRTGVLDFDRHRPARRLRDGGFGSSVFFLFRGLCTRQQKRRGTERDGNESEGG